jgi:tetratricopeptide (TPR) repeat protein
MDRFVLRTAAMLLALGVAAAPARADDAATCRTQGDDRIAACSRLIEQNARDGLAWFNRAIGYLNKAEHDRALSDLDEALRIIPRHAPAFVERGIVYNAKGEHDRALSDLDEALRIDPRSAFAYVTRAGVYSSKGDYDHAIPDYDEAIRLDPKHARAYAGRANAYFRKADFDRAIDDYGQAVNLDPRYASALNGRGNAYARKGEYGRAIASYDQALAINPKYAIAMVNRGQAYTLKGEFDRAAAEIEEAVRIDPKLALAYRDRGDLRTITGAYDLAIADYDEAIRLDPKMALAYAGRCGAYNHKGAYDRAIADCEEGIRLGPELAPAYSHRGFSYGKKGDIERAMADLNKAVAISPLFARGYANRATIHEQQGDLGRAVADYDEALKLMPGLPEARAGRDRVQAALALQQGGRQQEGKQAQAGGERRIALVIGNSSYRSAAFLPNPRRDAQAVASALRQAGFQTVEFATDLDRNGMVKALRSFREEADRADWALIYYAGHGIEVEHVNYLIPTDARLIDDRDVKTETISYEEMLSTVGGARALRIVVLDACRTNPFKDQMRRNVASRSATDRGLAPPPESKPGTLVVYSAKDGEVAADDAGGANSPFASAFVAQLKVPGREVRRLFDYVRDDVLEATKNRQQPFTYGSLPGRKDFYFVK